MVSSTAPTVAQYLATLPPDRRAAITAVRAVINANLPAGYEEGMQYGMIGWSVPLSRHADTYNGQPLALAGLASQKNHMALYLMTVYGDPVLERWFRAAFAAAGKRLDMGKSCVRFKTLDALPLDVIGKTVAKVPVAKLLARVAAATRPASRPRRAAAKVVAARARSSRTAERPAVRGKPARR